MAGHSERDATFQCFLSRHLEELRVSPQAELIERAEVEEEGGCVAEQPAEEHGGGKGGKGSPAAL